MRVNIGFAVAGLLISAIVAAPAWAMSLKVTSEDGTEFGVYDREALEALGLVEIQTETPWTEGVVSFEGVSLKNILADAGVSGRSLTALAQDDYAAWIENDMIEQYNPIVATRMNAAIMSIDDKGPFWIIFDFDDIDDEPSEELRSLAVWHLVELEVE